MTCKTRMTIIQPPITYIYSLFFIVGGVIAIIANASVLRILWFREYRNSRSNRILTSLAISDFLVGLVVFPLTSFQILNHASLNNCDIDFTRSYFSLLLQGSSCLSLAVISYDRYILMTKIQIYHRRYVKRTIIVLVFLAWFIPAVTPFLRFVGSLPYLGVTLAIYIIPYVVLGTSYFLITNAVRNQEALLKKHYIGSINIEAGKVNGAVEVTSATEQPREAPHINEEVKIHKKISTTKNQQNKGKSHIKLAKQVTILLLAYFFCVTSLLIWLILEFANILNPFLSPFTLQNIYLFAMVTISWNSCINPIIYYAKNPDIRRGFRKLFKIRRSKEDGSTTNSKTL